jgi:hypothetical protein
MRIPFLAKELIRKYVHEVLKEYEKVRRRPVTFPLDAADVFEKLLGVSHLLHKALLGMRSVLFLAES